MSRSERELLRWLAARVGAAPDVLVGMGDDGAVIQAGNGPLVVAQDQTLEGVHFLRAEVPWEGVGHKALARNLSDLAAMGARPWLALVSLAVPDGMSDADVKAVFRGLLRCAEQNETHVVGGDLSRSPAGLLLDVNVIGRLHGQEPLLRSGGQEGDELWVTGVLGGSRGGHHFQFQPRWREAQALRAGGPVHAAIDLSDGLGIDLVRLAEASGRGFDVDLSQVPRRITEDGPVGIEAALGDGEDFELLLALAPGFESSWQALSRQLGVPLTRIGVLTGDRPLARDRADAVPRPWPGGGHEYAFGD